MPNIIACEIHDYFEAVCMHQFELEISLNNGQRLSGAARDIVVKDRQEYLVLEQRVNNSELKKRMEVNLLQIRSVEVLTKNNIISSFKVN